ncbi:MAG: NADH-quinone oxidoreductase subunit L, partial [Planctomycetes bacterium]|nr:NADH-quinone oxidoreductase subunit L [Planctomycetota bacterium]
MPADQRRLINADGSPFPRPPREGARGQIPLARLKQIEFVDGDGGALLFTPDQALVGAETAGISEAERLERASDLAQKPVFVSALRQPLWIWFSAGGWEVSFGLFADRLTAVMLLVVTGVGFLIHVYSTGYMAGDPGVARFFAYLNLFCAAMLILVLGDGLPLLFMGWEGVGLCSYLLIGFWYGDLKNCDAGRKAFIVNRVGDAGFVLGMFLLVGLMFDTEAGRVSLSFDALREWVRGPSWSPGAGGAAAALAGRTLLGAPALTLAALLLFVGATGKSAQVPLYVWLPDAMAGPTPVSALIHAATMVTAGVYMVARMNFLFNWEVAPGAMAVMLAVGAFTALWAGLIALSQFDIKRVLAYSTISQLGYMFVGVGAGAYAAGVFHLMTHAFFKALLFLGAG